MTIVRGFMRVVLGFRSDLVGSCGVMQVSRGDRVRVVLGYRSDLVRSYGMLQVSCEDRVRVLRGSYWGCAVISLGRAVSCEVMQVSCEDCVRIM